MYIKKDFSPLDLCLKKQEKKSNEQIADLHFFLQTRVLRPKQQSLLFISTCYCKYFLMLKPIQV